MILLMRKTRTKREEAEMQGRKEREILEISFLKFLQFLFRIEGNQFEDRSINKMWLVRHLEVTRQLMLEDLKVVKVNTEREREMDGQIDDDW